MHRTIRTRGIALSAVAGLALAAAPAAHATPQILKTELPPPVVGKPLELRVTARDSAGPVTGMVTGFGAGQGGFGSSACGPFDSSGHSLAPPPTTTIVAPHTFTKPGAGLTTLRLMSSGCTGGVPSVVQQVSYTVTTPGQPAQPVVVAPPTTVPLGASVPALPGIGQIPLTTGDLPTPALPSLPTLPSLPPIKLPVLGSPKAAAHSGPYAQASARQLKAACPNAATPFSDSRAGQAQAQRTLFCLMNAERTRRGLRPIKPNRRLLAAAASHSRAMVAKRFFAHVGPGSLNLQQRLAHSRYLPRVGRWVAGENIGWGKGRYGTPLGMHQAWMHSTLHRHNILYPNFREAGFGIVRGGPFGRGTTYTTDFGARS